LHGEIRQGAERRRAISHPKRWGILLGSKIGRPLLGRGGEVQKQRRTPIGLLEALLGSSMEMLQNEKTAGLKYRVQLIIQVWNLKELVSSGF
jgi:hypothetical protein